MLEPETNFQQSSYSSSDVNLTTVAVGRKTTPSGNRNLQNTVPPCLSIVSNQFGCFALPGLACDNTTSKLPSLLITISNEIIREAVD